MGRARTGTRRRRCVADGSRPRAALPLCLLLIVACGRHESASRPGASADAGSRPALPGDGHRTVECRLAALPDGAPALPPGALLQSLIVAADGREAGFRIYEDGRFEAQPLGQDWAVGQALGPEQLGTVRRAIADGHLDRVAGAHRALVPSHGMGANWLQVRDGSAVVDLVFDDPCFVPEIDAVMAQLVEVFD